QTVWYRRDDLIRRYQENVTRKFGHLIDDIDDLCDGHQATPSDRPYPGPDRLSFRQLFGIIPDHVVGDGGCGVPDGMGGFGGFHAELIAVALLRTYARPALPSPSDAGEFFQQE